MIEEYILLPYKSTYSYKPLPSNKLPNQAYPFTLFSLPYIYIYALLPYASKYANTSLQIIDYNSKNKKIYVSNIKSYIIFADKELPLI